MKMINVRGHLSDKLEHQAKLFAAYKRCETIVGSDVGEFLVEIDGREYFCVYITRDGVVELRVGLREIVDDLFAPHGLTTVPGE